MTRASVTDEGYHARSSTPLAAAAHLLHGFLYGSFGFAGLLCRIPDLIVLPACYARAVLFTSATGLLFRHPAPLCFTATCDKDVSSVDH